MPVVAAAFNNINGGNIVAYACGYDWSHGYKGNTQGHANKIMLHQLKVGVVCMCECAGSEAN
jgi:mRNA export factor